MKYYLRNKKTGLFLQGYKGNKPLWTFSKGSYSPDYVLRLGDKFPAAYSKEDALKLQKRLECQSQMVELIEKIE